MKESKIQNISFPESQKLSKKPLVHLPFFSDLPAGFFIN